MPTALVGAAPSPVLSQQELQLYQLPHRLLQQLHQQLEQRQLVFLRVARQHASPIALPQATASSRHLIPAAPACAEVANVRSKHEVLDYMRRREREGEGYAALGELQDAYPGVRQDLEVSE